MTGSEDWAARARHAMLAEIAAEAADTVGWTGEAAFDPRVMAALDSVPRHAFVADNQRLFAYENRPLAIGQGQTISQPYMVALMSDLAALQPGDRVLEVGTGCGYQAAVLAAMGAEVISIERIAALAEAARARLQRLGYDRVEVQQGDGAKGWPPRAPYQAILVTAAAFDRPPPALVEQLAPGGRLVIPVEPRAGRRLGFGRPNQDLLLLTKDQDGGVRTRTVLPVAFVPLIEAD